jgi:cell division protein FtsI (penicillin-binding protein 3)
VGMKVSSSWRFYFLAFCLLLGGVSLIWRMVHLNILQRDFLLQQSNARVLRVVSIPAYRGVITDRYHQPLAISAQVDSIWVNPQVFASSPSQLQKLAGILKIPAGKIKNRILKDAGREFVYLKRGVAPTVAERVALLEIPGVYLQHDYHRFYPQSEVMAHVIGFTNVDDQGQEGLELAFDGWLRGVPGKKKVLKDRLGNVVAELDIVRQPRQGHDLTLSLDSRIQYLAYEELKRALEQFSAKSGSIVVLDSRTGEVLAMVNQPSYNPNHVQNMHDGHYRNRAMTDLFEPGSTIKPFTIASALESGRYSATSKINTSPGWFAIGGKPLVKDDANYGEMTLTKILQKSSDVGVAKISLSLSSQRLWELLHRVGFGERTMDIFPGEVEGFLARHRKWNPIELASLSFGYGISVTAVQLAQAYAIIAAGGIHRPVSLVKVVQLPAGKRVMSEGVARTTLGMLEAVVQGGTGSLAKVSGFRVGGKTGTAYIAGPNGYEKEHCVASFVGIAPVSEPRLVVAVVIKDPRGEQHSGALVAAPVFAKVAAGGLRVLNIVPDDLYH